MLETNPNPVFIEPIKPLFFFRISILPKESQITETTRALSPGVKNDFFLSGNSALPMLICLYLRLILLISNTVNQMYIKSDVHKITMMFSYSENWPKIISKKKSEHVLPFSHCVAQAGLKFVILLPLLPLCWCCWHPTPPLPRSSYVNLKLP